MSKNYFFKRNLLAFLLICLLITGTACGSTSSATVNDNKTAATDSVAIDQITNAATDNLQSNLVDAFINAIEKFNENEESSSSEDKTNQNENSQSSEDSNNKLNTPSNVPEAKPEEVTVQPEETTTNTHQAAQSNARSSNEIAQELAAIVNNTPSLALNIDDSQLSPKDQAVMAVVRPVAQNIMATYGTAVEREKAVHDYIVQNCNYAYDRYNSGTLIDDDFTIYGCIINHVCVCAGYAQTFKLFMDLMGIPCDYVRGVACNGDNHAWNAVQLDGQWYQVDVTWDDQPECYGGVDYSYFNVTDSYMKQTHSYSYQNPCTATQYSFENIAKTWSNYCASVDDYYAYVEKMVAQGNTRFTLYVNSSISNLKDYVVAKRIPNRPEGYRFHAYMISFSAEPASSTTPGIMMICITEYGGEL